MLHHSLFLYLLENADSLLSVGVVVKTDIKNKSCPSRWVFASAFLATCIANVAVLSPSLMILRCLIPVRVVIHSSEVSTIFSKVALSKIFSGTVLPVALITARCAAWLISTVLLVLLMAVSSLAVQKCKF